MVKIAMRRPGGAPVSLPRRLAVIALLTLLGLVGAAVTTPLAHAAAGTVAGVVFEDHNANGIRDLGSNAPGSAAATDGGVKNAAVTITDTTGATVGSATTDAAGSFSVAVTAAATAAVRVRTSPPGTFTAGPHGPDSRSTAQFVTLGTPAAGAIGVGLARPGGYSPDGPRLVNAVQSPATDGATLLPSTRPSVVSSAHGDRGITPTTPEATSAQTGAVWGLAQLAGRYVFSATFLKYGARTGPSPGGLGAIYLTDAGAAPNATPWVTIPMAGGNPRVNEAGMSPAQWVSDTLAVPQVARTGLGGLALAPDERNLYAVNLERRSLWRVPFTAAGGAPVASTGSPPVEIALPLDLPGAAVGCARASVRPFGVAAHDGSLWATLTCTGPTPPDLRGYVYRYDLATQSFDGAPAFEMALAGYARSPRCPTCEAWQAWSAGPGGPQPLLSDVAFDSDGDMTIAIKDRSADQGASIASGDILRACRNMVDTAWVLESNAVCGSHPLGARPNNQSGPGGGSFYADDFPPLSPGNLPVHDQVSLGALLQLPGYGEIINTDYDPGTDPNLAFNTDGYRFFSNANGAPNSHHRISTLAGGGFGKAGGLGDMAALVASAPLEIGNRVWLDRDDDGIQDAGEDDLPGVTVRLHVAGGGTPLATATTDASGNYYFSSAPGTSTGSASYAVAGLAPQTSYVLKADEAANYATGGPLAGLVPTAAVAGADRAVDSDGTPAGTGAEAAIQTGAPGAADHTIDFGFTAMTHSDIEVVKRADRAAVVGRRPITWTASVTNHGPDAAAAVVALDRPSLPVTFTLARTTAGTCRNAPVVRCDLGTLAAGATARITLVGRARVAGALRNEIEVPVEVTDPQPANNVATVTTQVRAKLKLRKVAERRAVRAGGQVGFRLRATNPSDVAVRRVRVCDRLPTGLVSVRTVPRAQRSGARHCWSLGTVYAHASKGMRIVTRIRGDVRGTRTNTATVTAAGIRARTARARVRVLGRAPRPSFTG